MSQAVSILAEMPRARKFPQNTWALPCPTLIITSETLVSLPSLFLCHLLPHTVWQSIVCLSVWVPSPPAPQAMQTPDKSMLNEGMRLMLSCQVFAWWAGAGSCLCWCQGPRHQGHLGLACSLAPAFVPSSLALTNWASLLGLPELLGQSHTLSPWAQNALKCD